MPLIYEPKGPALEYAKLAINLYKGCGHHCDYCYAPKFAFRCMAEEEQKRKFNEEVDLVGKGSHTFEQKRAAIVQKLMNDGKRYAEKYHHDKPQVLMSFTSDPYQPREMEWEITKQAIQILGSWGVPLIVLTKAPLRALRDLDLFKKYGVTLATTIVWDDDKKRHQWEPDTDSIECRHIALEIARKNGLQTLVSVEPVIEMLEGLAVIDQLCGKVDLVKVGPIDPRFDPQFYNQDWAAFLVECIKRFEDHKQSYYIKDRLWEFAEPGMVKEKKF